MQLVSYLIDTHLQEVLPTILNEFRAALFQDSDFGITQWNYGLSHVLKERFKDKKTKEKLFSLCTFKETCHQPYTSTTEK